MWTRWCWWGIESSGPGICGTITNFQVAQAKHTFWQMNNHLLRRFIWIGVTICNTMAVPERNFILTKDHFAAPQATWHVRHSLCPTIALCFCFISWPTYTPVPQWTDIPPPPRPHNKQFLPSNDYRGERTTMLDLTPKHYLSQVKRIYVT
jgi:hypothetical protein